jgi:Na+-driven multidrug efflux pump
MIGATVALLPRLWVGLFSADPAVLESGAAYLRTVGPFYPLMGAGITLYFASQGAARVVWPVLAGTARLVIVVTGGLLALAMGAPLGALYAIISLGVVVWGAGTILAVRASDWSRRPD